DDARAHAERVVAELGWTAPWFIVSGLSREGTREVMLKVQAFLDAQARDAADAADAAGTAGAGGRGAGRAGRRRGAARANEKPGQGPGFRSSGAAGLRRRWRAP